MYVFPSFEMHFSRFIIINVMIQVENGVMGCGEGVCDNLLSLTMKWTGSMLKIRKFLKKGGE